MATLYKEMGRPATVMRTLHIRYALAFDGIENLLLKENLLIKTQIMKKLRIMKYKLVMVLIATFILTSCSEDSDEKINNTIMNHQLVAVSLFVENENNTTPEDDETLLFETRTHAPVVDRNGNQITWGQFRDMKGTAIIQAKGNSTLITLHLKGLVPDGLYTIWNVTFKKPGFSTTEDNMIGVGVVGKSDGSESYFRATSEGTAEFAATVDAGDLSMLGKISAHPFLNEFEWHIVGSYHMDDKTHGPNLGPDGTVVEQFAFVFVPSAAQ